MMDFLDRLSEDIHKRFRDGLERVIVVFPGRRAGIYLQRQLALKASAPLIMPEIVTMEEFIESVSELSPMDDIDQIFALYGIYKSIEGEKARSLDEMMGWGQALLGDFNETDNYLADPDAIYTYLDEAKALSLWNPSGSELTEPQKTYLSFYGSLINYYHQFRKKLHSEGRAYPGLMGRIASEKVMQPAFSLGNGRHVVFAGFNALTRAEEAIITELLKKGEASIVWDADEYYLNDTSQEAGCFLRSYFNDRPIFGKSWISDDLSTGQKNIRITGVGLTTGQAVEVAGILAALPESMIDKTAVVINDDKLLLPLLNLLPPAIKDVNLTMGLSLRHTPAMEFLADYFATHLNYRQSANQMKFHLGPVVRLLNHPWVQTIVRNERDTNHDSSRQLANWRRERKLFVGSNELESLFGAETWQRVESLFKPWSNAKEGLDNLIVFLNALYDSFLADTERHLMEKSVLTAFLNALRRIPEHLGPDVIKNKRTLKSLIMRLIQRQSLRFSGEPLKGLQIMGMLETRLLDFDTIIVTGMNEGLLPKTGSQASFIPFDIRQHFQLPMPRDREAMYAYHFFRLLQRSKDIYLLYNTEVDVLNGGEKSRYIQQLVRELPQANKRCVITISESANSPIPRFETDLSVEKDDSIIERLKEVGLNSVSASHLMTYMRCQLQFFYRYVAGLEEKEEMNEIMDRSVLGSAIHHVLQTIFEGMPDFDAGNFLQSRVPEIPHLVEQAMTMHVQPESMKQGENYLLREVSVHMLQLYISQEIERMTNDSGRFRVLSLEKKHEHILNISDLDIRFRGMIDRVDQLRDGTVRVIDYKSGRVESSELKLNSVEIIHRNGRKNKAFQLMFYLWLFSKSGLETPTLTAGIYSFKSLNDGLLPLTIDGSKQLSEDQIISFENELESLVAEILNKELPFLATEDLEICRSCDFKSLCGRN